MQQLNLTTIQTESCFGTLLELVALGPTIETEEILILVLSAWALCRGSPEKKSRQTFTIRQIKWHDGMPT